MPRDLAEYRECFLPLKSIWSTQAHKYVYRMTRECLNANDIDVCCSQHKCISLIPAVRNGNFTAAPHPQWQQQLLTQAHEQRQAAAAWTKTAPACRPVASAHAATPCWVAVEPQATDLGAAAQLVHRTSSYEARLMWTPQVDLRVAAKGAAQLPHQCDNPLQANISNVGDYTMMAVSIDAFRLQRNLGSTTLKRGSAAKV